MFKTCYVILRIWLWGKSIIIPSNKRDEIHSFYNLLTDYFGIPRRQSKCQNKVTMLPQLKKDNLE